MSYYQTIYNRFRQAGYTEAAALGFIGNWQEESGCEPNRLQGDFDSFRTASKQYTAKVESGAITKHQFSSDQKGYGLAQWTYFDFVSGQGRKLDLYNFWKTSGKRLDDIDMQISFALWELSHGYAHVAREVKNNTDLYSCVDIICRKYEQPYYNNVQARFESAERIKASLDLSGSAVVSDNATTEDVSILENTTPKLETWPPRTIDEHCSGWPEVWLLQSVLKCRGYNVLVDGIWGSALTDKVKQFQREHQLDADGAIGPMSWAKLFDRG